MLLALLAATPSIAWADSPSADVIEGTVVDSTTRWGYGGDVLVTESVIERADGTRETVQQLGGRLGDIAMVVTHSPAPLVRGARVTARIAPAVAPTGRAVLQLTKVIESDTLPEGALPFVRTQNGSGAPLFWESSCGVVGLNEAAAATVPGDLEIDAISRAVDSWNRALATCSFFSIDFVGLTSVEPRFDGVTVIRFREDRWCRPAAGDDPEVCHDTAAAALTFLTFGLAGDRNGAILDADIELNGVNFDLTVDGVGGSGAGCDADIENTLAHEFGHLLGLDHTCWDGSGEQPVDNNGDLVRICFPEAQLSAEVRDATMYNFQDCGETKKQTLEQDDIAAVCSIYPLDEDPGECIHPVIVGGFCSSGGEGNGGGALVILLVAVALGWRRRA